MLFKTSESTQRLEQTLVFLAPLNRVNLTIISFHLHLNLCCAASVEGPLSHAPPKALQASLIDSDLIFLGQKIKIAEVLSAGCWKRYSSSAEKVPPMFKGERRLWRNKAG